MILCGGSATDLPEQTPQLARMFNTVDSFDTHAKIPEFFQAVNQAALEGRTLSVISTGWDPGLFSMNRLLMEAVLPE
ncbi:Meso-diaminopimelate D-dehydrogenase [compost metagenome]